MVEMVVGRDYLLKKTRGPYAATHFFNTRVVPGAVNTAGAVEVALDRAARATRLRPALLLALGSAVLATAAVARSSRP
jgi:hypothetical protein